MRKILVGACPLADARAAFDEMRDVDLTFAETPDEVIRLALMGKFDFVYTELDYQKSDREGFRVLEAIRDADCVPNLWTNLDGCRDMTSEEIRAKAGALGINIWDRRIPFSL